MFSHRSVAFCNSAITRSPTASCWSPWRRLVLAGLLLVRPARGEATLRRRLALAATRAAVIVLVILAMLRPTLVYTETKKEKATLVLLVDQSRSMSVPDALAGKTRWEALRGCLADAAPALRELKRDFEVKVYAFDENIHPVEIAGDGKIALPEKPQGQADGHRRRPRRRAAPGGGQAAAGRDPAQRRRAAGLGPPRPAAPDRRRLLETPGRSTVHRRLRPVAGTGRGPGRRRHGTAGQSHGVRQERIAGQRAGPRRRLRQPRHPRAGAVRDLAGQDGGRGPGERQGGRRRAGHPGQIQVHPADAGRIQADAGGDAEPPQAPPARRAGDDQQPAQHVRPRAQGRAERAVHRGGVAGGAEVHPPRAGRLARHPRRLPAAGRAAARDAPRRPGRRISSRASTRSTSSATSIRPPSTNRSCATWRRRSMPGRG